MKHTLILLLIAASIAVSIPTTTLFAQQAKVENLVQLETGGCRGYCLADVAHYQQKSAKSALNDSNLYFFLFSAKHKRGQGDHISHKYDPE